MTPGVLHVDGLTVRLGGRPVLDRIALDLAAGEFTGVIGPNGAGKTTLLRAVLGLVPAASGTVLVEGLPVRDARDRIGYVPQRHEYAWDFPVSVAGAVMTGRVRRIGWLRRPGPRDRAAVEEALERTGLTALRNRPVGELSGGQRQRVLVARALAAAPRLLLLDEPFTGVDVPTQALLTELFGRLAGEGVCLLMSTHDLPGARAVCTRLVLLNRTVVADGPPDALDDPALLLRAFTGTDLPAAAGTATTGASR